MRDWLKKNNYELFIHDGKYDLKFGEGKDRTMKNLSKEQLHIVIQYLEWLEDLIAKRKV
jgi:hypothetical protein